MADLSRRQRHILRALQNLGGRPTTSQIAREAEKTFGRPLHNNGVSQTLSSLAVKDMVRGCGRDPASREWTWELTNPDWDQPEGMRLSSGGGFS